MKWSILDFERSELKQFNNKREAVKYFAEVVYSSASVGASELEHNLRYVANEQIDDPSFNNGEWLEVNCHNNSQMVFPTNRVDADHIYKMIEYWHEQIAFGDFGSESVEFNFHDAKLQRGYGDFTDNKWLHENLKTWEELVIDTGMHDYCDHWDELEAEVGAEIASAEDLTLEQEAIQDRIYSDCEDYQINQYIYDTGNGFYGARSIDRETKRAYILQINEFAEVAL